MPSRENELLKKIEDLENEIKSLKDRKKYGLVWEDKPEQVVLDCQNKIPVLKEVKKKGIKTDKNKPVNILIEGDNYHSLSVLSYTHKGKIDVIYIDPPYNTGNKDFVYNDRFVDKDDSYRHSKWLSFMSKRLTLARDLLKDDGVIFISIDDNELAQLKILCDEVFGEKNFVECISWDKKSSAKGVPPKSMIVNTHEYIMVYKKTNKFSFVGEKRSVEGFSNPDNDPRGLWRNTNIKSTVKNKELSFSIIDPKSKNIFKDTWAYSKKELQRLIDEDYLIFPKNKHGQVRKKEFFNEFKNKNIPIKSSFGVFDNQKNTEMLKSILKDVVFLNPKPLSLLIYLIKVVSNSDVTILDFFAGFRVIIVIEANSYVNIRSSRLLPKFKTQKINSWCAA